MTIYPGQSATVTRHVTVAVGEAVTSVAFEGLPATLVGSSLRLEAPQGVRVGALETAREPVGAPVRERERALRAQLDELEQKRQVQRDRKSTAKAQLRFIKGLSSLPERKGAASELLTPDGVEWSALIDRIGEGGLNAREEIRWSQSQIEQLEREIEATHRKLDQLGRDRPERVTVTAPVETASPGQHELRLSYRVRGPQWKPVYEARLDTAGGEVMIERKARISQATGEDWSGVDLALSTSRPIAGKPPKLESWWVDVRDPDEGPKPMIQAEAAEGALKAQSRASADAAQSRAADTVHTEFAATYEIPAQVSIPGDGQDRQVAIARETVPADVTARVFPQRAERAWLTAEVEWDGAGTLPAGRVARFRDGAYIGSARLDAWAPGEARALTFGADPKIEVDFDPLADETGESGLITSKETQTRRHRLTLTNNHDRALPVTAVFRVPVGRDEQIEVAPRFELESDVDEWQGQKGVHAWHFDLHADEKRAVKMGYEVAYPPDLQIMGL